MINFFRSIFSSKPKPPIASIKPHHVTHIGKSLTDDYYWLRDKENPEVIAYLRAENTYTDALMKPTEALQDTLYREMLSRIREDDRSVPEQIGEFLYYYRTEKDKQYKIYCRKKNGEENELVLLDLNTLARHTPYLALGAYRVSPDHHWLAFTIDHDGSEQFTLYIKNLETGELSPEHIPNTYYGLEWANNSATIFYTTLDPSLRPHRVYRHSIGAELTSDQLVYEESDERYYLDLTKSRSGRFLLITLASKTTTEVHFLDADHPDKPFQVFQERVQGHEYNVEHWEDRFFITTNDQAVNFRLMETPADRTNKQNWREVIAHRDDALLLGVDAFRDFIVIHTRTNGLKSITIRTQPDRAEHTVLFPEPVYSYTPLPNPDYNASFFRLNYTSLVTPSTVMDYDIKKRELTIRKQEEVAGYDANDYSSERILVQATDGTLIPMSIVYKKDRLPNKPTPALLYGYGSYGICIDPQFASHRISLLDRGFVFAIAHIRGGDDLGRKWYEDGKFLHKKNTFTDFIACARHLISQGYTTPAQLAIMGGSAGGLLMGAVINMQPDLFGAVVAHVPFVDVVNTMLDPNLPLTITEYEEWGNPNDPAYFDYMMSYAPYENVKRQAYPHILVTAGLNDPRVSYWEPAKWVAKLRRMKTNRNDLLMRTHMDFGHSGASGRYDYLLEIAFDYAFIIEKTKPSGRS